MDSSYRVDEILPSWYSLVAMTPIEVRNFSGGGGSHLLSIELIYFSEYLSLKD